MVKKICKYDCAEHNAVLLSKIDNGDSQYQLGFNAGMLKGKRVGAKEELEFNIREIKIVHDWLRSDLSVGVIRQRLINIIEKNNKRLKELEK